MRGGFVEGTLLQLACEGDCCYGTSLSATGAGAMAVERHLFVVFSAIILRLNLDEQDNHQEKSLHIIV